MEKFLKAMLVLLLAFIPAYLWLGVEFCKIGDLHGGILSFVWAGFLVLAWRWGRRILDDEGR